MAKKTYTAAPDVPPEMRERYLTVLEVLSAQTTVSEGARRLGMARNHFQTLMHRGLEGLLAGISPGRAGRPAKPEREAALERELAQVKKQNEELEQRLGMMDRLTGLASEMARGSSRARTSRRKPVKTTTTTETDDEEPCQLAQHARALHAEGIARREIARVLGVSESTVRRWERPRALRASRRTPVAPDVLEAAVDDIRELRGLVGANALRRAHAGLSRRVAAELKAETLTAIERERRARGSRVIVAEPGVMRGFDAMHVSSGYLLVSGDAAVPYRTSIAIADRYDGPSVAAALRDDFDRNGAPYVLRCDRARAHQCESVRAVLDRFEVVVLHGPPRHPGYYGQLERQNREHRAWLDASKTDVSRELIEQMKRALNEHWRRPSLGFETAGERWRARRPAHITRSEFRESVARTRSLLLDAARQESISDDVATRLAVEQTMIQSGVLRIENPRRVLGDIECGNPLN